MPFWKEWTPVILLQSCLPEICSDQPLQVLFLRHLDVYKRQSQFWKELDKEIPSLILLDVMLPEEDGISILKKLRTRPDTRKLPIIMLTAKGSEYDVCLLYTSQQMHMG